METASIEAIFLSFSHPLLFLQLSYITAGIERTAGLIGMGRVGGVLHNKILNCSISFFFLAYL